MSTFPDCTGSDTLFSTPVMEYKDRGNYSNDKEMTSNAYTNDTMTNDNPFLDMKQDDSGNSLSLDIRNTQFSSNGNTSVSASTTLNTTAATNTPATNVNSLPSPDFNSYSQFDSPEVLNSSSMNFKLGNGGGGSDPLQQQQQNSAFENSSLSTASSGTKLNNGSRNYDYYKVNNKSNIGSNHQRISHTHTLSTPTAMNDFIAMLDAQSAIQQQVRPRQQDEQTLGHSSYQYESNSDLSSNEFTITASKNQEDNDSLSPLRNSSAQFIDPNLLKSNMFIDTLGLSQSNDDQALNNGSGDENIFQQSSLSSLLDDYVSTDLLVDDPTSMNNSTKLAHMHSNPDKNLFSNDRRHSEVITKAVPEITDSRGSISHSIDFWNLPDRRNTINECLIGKNIDEKEAAMPTSSFNMDNELTQVLNEYNMNFTRSSRRGSHGANPTYISNSNGPPSQRHGIKKQQRGSMSVLDGSLNGDLFSKLYKNGHRSSNLKVVSWENAVLSDDDDEYGRRSIDASLPNLEPIISPKSPKSVGASKQQKNQFIKPSMMLSDNASAAAKVATTGAEKIDLISGVERRSYDISMNSSMKIKRSPPPHYQTIKPCPVGSVNPSMSAPAAATRRRRSTPNIMTIRNATSGATFNGGGKSKSRSITPMSGADDEAKPFKCKECSKAFRRSEHLKRHIRSVHSSERPFACMFCEKKFSRSDNLSQHLKTHKKHGDF